MPLLSLAAPQPEAAIIDLEIQVLEGRPNLDFVTSKTSALFIFASTAARRPAPPPPITNTSQSIVSWIFSFISFAMDLNKDCFLQLPYRLSSINKPGQYLAFSLEKTSSFPETTRLLFFISTSPGRGHLIRNYKNCPAKSIRDQNIDKSMPVW